MPEKKNKPARRYRLDGRTFIWTTEEGVEISIPMRVKLGVIRKMGNRDMDATAMFDILESLVPDHADALDEMDLVTDFEPMFKAWQKEYNALAGATPGE